MPRSDPRSGIVCVILQLHLSGDSFDVSAMAERGLEVSPISLTYHFPVFFYSVVHLR